MSHSRGRDDPSMPSPSPPSLPLTTGCRIPCLPNEEGMTTVHNPLRNSIHVDPEIVRFTPGGSGSERPPFKKEQPEPKLVQNPQKPDKDMAVVQEAMAEGFVKYGLPISAAAVAGTFLMRRRYRQFKATPVESFVLSTLHYYGALSLGLYTGMTLYAPEFESKVLERAPNSSIARAIRDTKGSK